MCDSRFADEEAFGNLFVFESLGDQDNDLVFSRGQSGNSFFIGIEFLIGLSHFVHQAAHR